MKFIFFHIKKGLITEESLKNSVLTVYKLRYASIYSKNFKYDHILRYKKNKIQFNDVIPIVLN